MWQTWTAFCKDVGAFVAIAHVCDLRCVGFGKHQVDKSGHGSSPFSNAAPVTPCRYDSRAKSGECRGGAASHSAVKKPTLAGRFDGEN
ncbi:hypothetical protein DIL44_20720 [Salmonella enterica]|nr:hypothetical protein [Salmonella enterica]